MIPARRTREQGAHVWASGYGRARSFGLDLTETALREWTERGELMEQAQRIGRAVW